MDLTVTVSTHEDGSLVELAGALDFTGAPFLRHVVFELLDDGRRRIAVDVAGLRLLDAGAIRALLYLHGRAEQLGGGLHVAGAGGAVLTALEITGVAKTLRAYEELDWPATGHDRRVVPLDGAPSTHGLWPVEVTDLLSRLHHLAPQDPARARLREDIIERCLPAAYRLARRFYTDSLNDLLQVAALGLVKAVDGFDAVRGVEFGTYATPTVIGEIKRHFRDRNAGIRLPRRLQELRLAANRARDDLTQTLGHAPSVPELAAHLDVDTEKILELLGSTGSARPLSLDLPVTGAGAGAEQTLGDTVGVEDPRLDLVDDRATLQALIARLPEREQRILSLRFYGNQSQSEIALEVGLSQMHVSRLLRHSLDYLHRHLTDH